MTIKYEFGLALGFVVGVGELDKLFYDMKRFTYVLNGREFDECSELVKEISRIVGCDVKSCYDAYQRISDDAYVFGTDVSIYNDYMVHGPTAFGGSLPIYGIEARMYKLSDIGSKLIELGLPSRDPVVKLTWVID